MSMDKMAEALLAARDAAVEARAREYGQMYNSTLEGYGDLTREMLNLQGSVKELKKEMADIADWVSAKDAQELHKTLVLMDGKAQRAAYDALRICAAVRMLEETVRIRTGGDLLDMIQGSEEKDLLPNEFDKEDEDDE